MSINDIVNIVFVGLVVPSCVVLVLFAAIMVLVKTSKEK